MHWTENLERNKNKRNFIYEKKNVNVNATVKVARKKIREKCKSTFNISLSDSTKKHLTRQVIWKSSKKDLFLFLVGKGGNLSSFTYSYPPTHQRLLRSRCASCM